MNVQTWPHMLKILEAKTTYDEAIRGGLSVPRNRRELTIANAKWFIEAAPRFNASTPLFKNVLDTCKWYVLAYETKPTID